MGHGSTHTTVTGDIGGALPGSELDWIGNYVARDGSQSTYRRFMTDQFDWDRVYRWLDLMESSYSGSNPDPRRKGRWVDARRRRASSGCW